MMHNRNLQPGRLWYFFGTWTGRILLINTLVFLFTAWRSGSLMIPDTESLLMIGVKDPVGLANGEYWRLIAPVFIHIGVIHFAMNSFMLHVIGQQLEQTVGKNWFVFIYLVSGIAGAVSSALFSVHMSAGASGAIFGLLGCGYFIERGIGKKIHEVTGRRPANRAYAATVAINLVFGFMMPFIDNAAHVGGLLAGVLSTFAMVNLRPNKLQETRRGVGKLAVIVLFLALIAGSVVGSNRDFILGRLSASATSTESAPDKLHYLSQMLLIDPNDIESRITKIKLLYLLKQENLALGDIRFLLGELNARESLLTLANELEKAGLATESWQLRRLVENNY